MLDTSLPHFEDPYVDLVFLVFLSIPLVLCVSIIKENKTFLLKDDPEMEDLHKVYGKPKKKQKTLPSQFT